MEHLFSYIANYIDWLSFGVTFNMERLGMRVRDERGAISIELAIVIAILVGIAIAVGAVLFVRARGAANQVPIAPDPSTSIPLVNRG